MQYTCDMQYRGRVYTKIGEYEQNKRIIQYIGHWPKFPTQQIKLNNFIGKLSSVSGNDLTYLFPRIFTIKSQRRKFYNHHFHHHHHPSYVYAYVNVYKGLVVNDCFVLLQYCYPANIKLMQFKPNRICVTKLVFDESSKLMEIYSFLLLRFYCTLILFYHV